MGVCRAGGSSGGASSISGGYSGSGRITSPAGVLRAAAASSSGTSGSDGGGGVAFHGLSMGSIFGASTSSGGSSASGGYGSTGGGSSTTGASFGGGSGGGGVSSGSSSSGSGYTGGTIHAAIQTRHNIEFKDVPSTGGNIQPTLVEVGASAIPLNILFRSASSSLNVQQQHQSSQGDTQESSSEDEPHRLIHSVTKPIIQEVHELITPFRKITQEIQPVQEEIQTIVSRNVDGTGQQQQQQQPQLQRQFQQQQQPQPQQQLTSGGASSFGGQFAGFEPQFQQQQLQLEQQQELDNLANQIVLKSRGGSQGSRPRITTSEGSLIELTKPTTTTSSSSGTKSSKSKGLSKPSSSSRPSKTSSSSGGGY